MESMVNKMTNHEYVKLLQAQLKPQVVLSDIASYWTLVDVVYAQNNDELKLTFDNNANFNMWCNEDNYQEAVDRKYVDLVAEMLAYEIDEETGNSNVIIASNPNTGEPKILNYNEALIYFVEGEDAFWALPSM